MPQSRCEHLRALSDGQLLHLLHRGDPDARGEVERRGLLQAVSEASQR